MDERPDGIGVREMDVKYGDGRPRIQRRPARERKGDVLVVVQDGPPAWKTSTASGETSSARYQIHWAAYQWYAVSRRTTCPIAGNGKCSDFACEAHHASVRAVSVPQG